MTPAHGAASKILYSKFEPVLTGSFFFCMKFCVHGNVDKGRQLFQTEFINSGMFLLYRLLNQLRR